MNLLVIAPVVSQYLIFRSATSRRLFGLRDFKAIKCLSTHPLHRNYFISSHYDGYVFTVIRSARFTAFVSCSCFSTIALWDSRKLNKKQSSAVQEVDAHTKNVESAYFSPLSGNLILSTSVDDTIKWVEKKLHSCRSS